MGAGEMATRSASWTEPKSWRRKFDDVGLVVKEAFFSGVVFVHLFDGVSVI